MIIFGILFISFQLCLSLQTILVFLCWNSDRFMSMCEKIGISIFKFYKTLIYCLTNVLKSMINTVKNTAVKLWLPRTCWMFGLQWQLCGATYWPYCKCLWIMFLLNWNIILLTLIFFHFSLKSEKKSETFKLLFICVCNIIYLIISQTMQTALLMLLFLKPVLY